MNTCARSTGWRAPPRSGFGFPPITGPGLFIRSRTTGSTPMPGVRVKGHRGWPFGAQAPGPDDARPRRRTRAGGCFAKPVLNESALPQR